MCYITDASVDIISVLHPKRDVYQQFIVNIHYITMTNLVHHVIRFVLIVRYDGVGVLYGFHKMINIIYVLPYKSNL